MTDSSAIQVRHLGKRYQLGPRLPYRTLRESVTDALRAPLRKLRRPRPGNNGTDHFWALKDVSFDVPAGECVGIIGRNGAGKSTLLKVLSRITEPTEGYADLHGRVGSLLEVGTGFHNELSGRDNIYLNGSILGMRKTEIDRKFDEIVAFAEVERFIDTPVKRYSSGMYMRLAFAVAAHLEPDILVVDEVLAVGDSAFQKKCMGKMGQVARQGRTVLFVSHNMAAVQSLCHSAVWLSGGRVLEQGPAGAVVQKYLQSVDAGQSTPLRDRTDRTGDGTARIVSLRIEPAEGGPGQPIRPTNRLRITIGYESDAPLLRPGFLATIHDAGGAALYAVNSDFTGGLPDVLPPRGEVTCVTDPIRLTAGRCYVNVEVFKGLAAADEVQYAAFFDVEDEDVYGTGKMPERNWVMCVLGHRWTAGAA